MLKKVGVRQVFRENPERKTSQQRGTSDHTKQKADRVLYFKDEKNYEVKAMSILTSVGNLRLVGETGTGKSTLVEFLANKYDWELYQYSLTTDTSRFDLIAMDTLEADEHGGTRIVPRLGIVTQWLLSVRNPDKKQVLFLDEFNYAQPSVMTILNSLTDDRRAIWIPELMGYEGLPDPKNPWIQRTKNHWIIIAMNPAEKSQYTGTFAMNIAQLRRFESLHIEYLEYNNEFQTIKQIMSEMGYEDVNDLIVQNLLNVAQSTRKQYLIGELSVPITTGNILNYLKMFYHPDSRYKLSLRDIHDLIISMYPTEERELVRSNLQTYGVL